LVVPEAKLSVIVDCPVKSPFPIDITALVSLRLEVTLKLKETVTVESSSLGRVLKGEGEFNTIVAAALAKVIARITETMLIKKMLNDFDFILLRLRSYYRL
jgi:hypothetical protein